jgi:2-polyprenyl-3-methyl-5-hydroxy-6-metoxy-1,4-benzoquinol methylase
MTEFTDPWGAVSSVYEDGTLDVDENIDLTDRLGEHLPDAPAKGLDFGTGCGWLAGRLNQRGLQMTGVDSSPVMLNAARSIFGDDVRWILGGVDDIPQEHFDFMLMIMLLQFIRNLDDFASRLPNTIDRLVIGQFTPEAIERSVQSVGATMERSGDDFFMNQGSTRFSIFPRTPDEVARPFEAHGWRMTHQEQTGFSEALLRRYPELVQEVDRFQIIVLNR